MRQTISQWFHENDLFFENPFAAIFVAGYSPQELAGEYKLVFGDQWQSFLASDQSSYYSSWHKQA